MIRRTFGDGGDHADPSAVWTYLCGIDPLTDDYEFEQVGNCTINNSWPDTTIAANRLDMNNHRVKIYCPWASCHQGDPTKGYKIYLNGVAGVIDLTVVNSVVNQDYFTLENLYLELTSGVAGINAISGGDNVAGAGNAANFTFNNILIKGYSTAWSTGIYLSHQDCIYKISNCKIWNINVGINPSATSSGGALPADNRVEPITIENCTVYNTGSVAGGIHRRNDTANVRRVEFRNVVACGCVLDWQQAFTNVSNHFYNCADSDNSITTLIAAGFNNVNDCISNIVLADEFQSLLDSNENFLRLVEGTAALSAAVSPTTGKAPLDVDFGASLAFQGGAPNLGKNGAEPEISGHTTDIKGQPVPGYDDAYSIGADELAYSNFPES